MLLNVNGQSRGRALRGTEVETLSEDARFNELGIVRKYPQDFVRHFLPKYCTGIKLVQRIGDNIRVEARLTLLSKLSSKSEKYFLIPVKDVEDWRKNINLHTFMSAGKV